MFVDRATVKIRSGKGGDGCSHLRREKFMPKGDPTAATAAAAGTWCWWRIRTWTR